MPACLAVGRKAVSRMGCRGIGSPHFHMDLYMLAARPTVSIKGHLVGSLLGWFVQELSCTEHWILVGQW